MPPLPLPARGQSIYGDNTNNWTYKDASVSYIQRAYAKATLHSFKGWLDTFAIQAGFQQDQIDTLLHWSNKTMRRHYHRNPQAVEVHLRQKVVALLAPASGWASAGVGSQMREPPVLSAVHPVQVTHQF